MREMLALACKLILAVLEGAPECTKVNQDASISISPAVGSCVALPISPSSVHPDVGGGYVALVSIDTPHTHPAVTLVRLHHTELFPLLHAYGALTGACSR